MDTPEAVVEEQEVLVPEVAEQVNPLSMSDEEFSAYEASEEQSEPMASEGEEVYSGSVTEASDSTELEFSKETAYDELMSEFKANGKMMKVDTVEDARQLMQMGANYNKKMSGLKDKKNFITMLENNDLLDEDRLNYLIDLSKKDKGAIQQLIKDSEIDPSDIDLGDATYTPNAYGIDEKQVQLDEVLESLQETETYATTIDIVGNKWDLPSREALASNPQEIANINEHVANGIYDKVIAVVDQERMMGRLDGLTDFDAYVKVGNRLNSEGKLTIGAPEPVQSQQSNVNPTINNQRRAAASSTKSVSTKTTDYKNPLSMSDEEFNKAFGSEF